GKDPASDQAIAVQADTQEHVFASTFMYESGGGGGGESYYQELARRGIIATLSLSGNEEWNSGQIARYAPYIWSYRMASDNLLANYGEWMCNRLAGRLATHAGAHLSSTARTFAVIQDYWDPGDAADLTPLRAALSRCGVDPMVIDAGTTGTPSSSTS